VEYISPSTEEAETRNEAVKRIKAVVKKLWPDSETEVFGSLKTDLLLPTSDIDLVVLQAPFKDPLEKLANALRKSKTCSSVKLISNAKVPILKLTDAHSGYQFDVSFNIPSGIANTKIVCKFLNEFSQLRPLVLVLKYFLLQRGLNEPYSGGIGSYTLVLMLVSFLQMRSCNQPDSDFMDLGILLRDFLEFYGSKFNYYCTGVNVLDGGSYYSKKAQSVFDPNRPFLLSIKDPQDDENDVGKNSWQIMLVKAAFAHAAKSLDQAVFGPTPLSRIIQKDVKLEEFRKSIQIKFRGQIENN